VDFEIVSADTESAAQALSQALALLVNADVRIFNETGSATAVNIDNLPRR